MSQPAEDPTRRGRSRVARLALAGALTVGAMAIVPVAQANTLSKVRVEVHSADAALHKVVAATSGGSVSGPLASLEAQLRAAGRDSAKLARSARHANSATGRLQAVTALVKLASQENRDAVVLTPLIGQLGGANQTGVAAFIASVTQGREQALAVVTPLLGQLPAPVQGTFAGIVAQLSNSGSGQVGQLAGAISPGSIACPAIDAVSQVVATALASVQADLARVQSILSLLPVGAQGQFTSVLGGLPTQLNALVASLKQAFSCSSTTPGSGQPAIPGLSGVTGLPGVAGAAGDPTAIVGSLIGSVMQVVQSLISGIVPGVAAGHVPSPVAVPAPVSGLLGQVTAVVPGLGGLLGGGSGAAGGLLGGLLGGLPLGL